MNLKIKVSTKQRLSVIESGSLAMSESRTPLASSQVLRRSFTRSFLFCLPPRNFLVFPKTHSLHQKSFPFRSFVKHGLYTKQRWCVQPFTVNKTNTTCFCGCLAWILFDANTLFLNLSTDFNFVFCICRVVCFLRVLF